MEELQRSKDTVCISEIIYEGQAEQGVELDHTLPDYYPEIFKILSCRLTPRILSYNVMGDSKMVLDGSVDIKVLYLAEGSNAIHCIDQHYTYSKSVEIGKGAAAAESDLSVKLLPKADYCNCRAVSGRRIDVRGAVSTKIRITADKQYSLPSIPESIQLKTVEFSCCANARTAEKQFTIREEIETGAHGISCILRNGAAPKISDIRIIADKVVVKGTITLNAAYGLSDPNEQGCHTVERMTAEIPVSHILDIAGIDDEYNGSAEINILDMELGCTSDSGIVSCNIMGVCRVTCTKQDSVKLPVDAYSTEYETEQATGQLKLTKTRTPVSKQVSVKSVLNSECGEIESVLDCSADIYNLTCTQSSDNELLLKGAITTQALCMTSDNILCFIEKQDSFECSVNADIHAKNSAVIFNAHCTDTDYSIRQDGELDVTAKIDLDCVVSENEHIPILESIILHEDRPLNINKTYALKICYANDHDNCWTIAKRYHTPVGSVMAENDIEDENALLSGMVIIPAM